MNPFSQRLRDLARGDAQSLTDIDRLSLADEQMLLESADRLDEQETAVAQAVAFAQYVEDHAKGGMVEAARKFLSLPFSQEIAARLKRVAELEAERADDDALRERMSDILKRTAIALRGPEPPLTAWSWHDLPERAAAAIASIDLFQRVAHNLADPRDLQQGGMT